VAAITGALLIILLLGEVVVLLSGVNNDFLQPARTLIIPRSGGPYDLTETGFVPHATIRTAYATDPRDYFDQRSGIDHLFNSEGWRDIERTPERPPGTYRILGLGDSYLMGQGVRAEDLFLNRLEDLLSERIDGMNVETINTGQAAYNSAMELQLLQKRGLQYQPNLVLLCFVPNDVEPDVFSDQSKVEFLTEFTNSYVTDDWLTDYSSLWTWAKRRISYQIQGQRYLRESIDSYRNDSAKWDYCRTSLLGIHKTCQAAGVDLAVVIFPFFVNLDGNYPFQFIHDQVRTLFEEQSVPVLDLRDSFRDFEGPELWVHPTDQHPNEIAHKIAAQSLGEFLLPRIREETGEGP
jgi:hypothetical protein